jgi:murein DD-endopeptidase MepM/ murein hydrolase activator NlpD
LSRVRSYLPVLLILITAGSISIAQDAPPVEPTTPPRPMQPPPVTTQQQQNVTLQRYFSALPQGGVGVMELQGENITDAQVLFRGQQIPFIPLADRLYALVVADIDTQPRTYPLSVLVQQGDDTLTFNEAVTIESAGFIRQVFAVPPAIGYLIEPSVERQEFARIAAITAERTPERAWAESGWILPIDAPFTSGFGQYRILNETVQTRHTGLDQRAPVGTPISAMADGTVVFAGRLDIRGNYVMINHGWGIYSGYAHLSQINVERGQTVAQGQLIGASGNTGRSQGPHLHWEIAVNGEWVNGEFLLSTWLP